MLLRITKYSDIDRRKLMDVYAESNFENTDYFFPDEPDKEAALEMVEEGFMDYLKNRFFTEPNSTYWVLEENGVWISAMRTCQRKHYPYYIEALETRPDMRKRGYGSRLMNEVLDTMKRNGPFRIASSVSKKNLASINTHLKCGFRIVLEEGYDYISEESDPRDYGFEFRYPD